MRKIFGYLFLAFGAFSIIGGIVNGELFEKLVTAFDSFGNLIAAVVYVTLETSIILGGLELLASAGAGRFDTVTGWCDLDFSRETKKRKVLGVIIFVAGIVCLYGCAPNVSILNSGMVIFEIFLLGACMIIGAYLLMTEKTRNYACIKKYGFAPYNKEEQSISNEKYEIVCTQIEEKINGKKKFFKVYSYFNQRRIERESQNKKA